MYLCLSILNVKCQKVFTIFNLTDVQICNVIKFKLEGLFKVGILIAARCCNNTHVITLKYLIGMHYYCNSIEQSILFMYVFISQTEFQSVVQFQLDICRGHI